MKEYKNYIGFQNDPKRNYCLDFLNRRILLSTLFFLLMLMPGYGLALNTANGYYQSDRVLTGRVVDEGFETNDASGPESIKYFFY